MQLCKGFLSFIKLNLIYVRKNYLNTKMKLFEFLSFFLILQALSFLFKINIFPPDSTAFAGQTQSFVSFYLSFRFGFLGLFFVFFTTLIDLISVTIKYAMTSDINLLNGIISKLFTLITSTLVAILSQEQAKSKKRFKKLAVTDELTDVYNQRYFHSSLKNKLENVTKSGSSLGLILIDIDNFKTYNDIFGHDNGDKILQGTAKLLKEMFNEDGLICRYGGDEFAIIIEDKDFKSIENRASKIKENYEKLKKVYFSDEIFSKVTLSMGLSEYPNMAQNKNDLISQADMALYHAKNLGRNKVHFYQDVILQLRKSIKTDNQQLIGMFKGLLGTISAKDKYTLGHCERVSSYAVMLAEALDLSPKDISIVQYAGLLHDIGKIEMPKSVLNKKDDLSEDEKDLLKQHPIYSGNILEPLEGMENLIDYVIHHHEKYDGTGYPSGLAGKNIGLGARILCIADCFDAMISERPYSKSMNTEDALNELERCSGKQFDPDLVKVFVRIIRSKPDETVITDDLTLLDSYKKLA